MTLGAKYFGRFTRQLTKQAEKQFKQTNSDSIDNSPKTTLGDFM